MASLRPSEQEHPAQFTPECNIPSVPRSLTTYSIVVMVWAPAIGLLLWQRLRERLIAPSGAPAGDANVGSAADQADAGNAASGITG
jgi:hypothetical protein